MLLPRFVRPFLILLHAVSSVSIVFLFLLLPCDQAGPVRFGPFFGWEALWCGCLVSDAGSFKVWSALVFVCLVNRVGGRELHILLAQPLDIELLKDLRSLDKPPTFDGTDAEHQDFHLSFRDPHELRQSSLAGTARPM